jgi:hypothetical protein
MGHHTTSVSVSCPRCGALATCTYVANTGKTLKFSTSFHCEACSLAEEADYAELTDAAREAFYRAEGRWELTLKDLGLNRIEPLRVLRETLGVSPAELSKLLRTRATLSRGTLAEIEQFAEHLMRAGAKVEVTRVG